MKKKKPKEKMCSVCKICKPAKEFYSDRRSLTGLTSPCKECHNVRCQSWARKNKDKVNAIAKRYRDKHPEKISEIEQRWYRNHPQYWMLKNARARCTYKDFRGYEYYGGKGIQCHLTLDDVFMLWERDAADTLNDPSLDRIDSDGHYCVENCRIIERSENCRLGAISRWKTVDQRKAEKVSRS